MRCMRAWLPFNCQCRAVRLACARDSWRPGCAHIMGRPSLYTYVCAHMGVSLSCCVAQWRKWGWIGSSTCDQRLSRNCNAAGECIRHCNRRACECVSLSLRHAPCQHACGWPSHACSSSSSARDSARSSAALRQRGHGSVRRSHAPCHCSDACSCACSGIFIAARWILALSAASSRRWRHFCRSRFLQHSPSAGAGGVLPAPAAGPDRSQLAGARPAHEGLA